MKSFPERLAALTAPLDPTKHARELELLRGCRTVSDLESRAREGWLSPDGQRVRLKLVRHGSGTFLVVQYDQGWSKTLSQG